VTRLRARAGVLLAVAVAAVPATAVAAPVSVTTGLDGVLAAPPHAWVGRRLGLVTHDAARDARGRTAAEALSALPGVHLEVLFAPEHGLRVTAAGAGGDGRDARTGLPVWTLQGLRRAPSRAHLDGLEVLVVDMQDAGARHYTYEQTLWAVLEAAGRARKPVWVLDRPTPVGGPAQGAWPISRRGLVGGAPVPLRHGLTLGELARFAVSTLPEPPSLHVVPVRGWSRPASWPDGLRWQPPSPALMTSTDALRYCGLGLFEATNVQCRRPGRAFRWFGATWVDGPGVVGLAEAAGLPGVRFRVASDRGTPGVLVEVLDNARYEPVDTGLALLDAFSRRHPHQFRVSAAMMEALAGTDDVAAMVGARGGWRTLAGVWRREGARFEASVRPFRLYGGQGLSPATFPPPGR
jgi:uncharacterized protein YbbC (DUF1343 family)